jgi:two-component system KDP operon response regulator KdpE
MVVLAMADDPSRREYAPFLTEHGFTVLTAAEGSEATELAARFLPEIVVLDLARHGLAPVQSLRGNLLATDLGIVALSPDVTEHAVRFAQDSGCDVVLESPCAAETLLTELLITLARLMPDSDAGGASVAT